MEKFISNIKKQNKIEFFHFNIDNFIVKILIYQENIF
jgi:hypothetical protein